MSDIVIKAENLGKKYTIGHQAGNGRYLALRDVLMQNARNLWHKTKDLARGKPIIIGDELEEVWALKDVSFEVRRGEVVGIIGRNGAGKSTLLKVLSRITEPSAGRVTIKGRVASLLEVGTGFHPELTGRENIYLNGAILGMTRAEIKRKFDEIVAFAEVERYLDTPVKRYSSGMYVRLAFAVAAHLEPEILLVDEVLAVGDAAFQKKCLGKMGDVAKEGRTVLFVSHNMSAIAHLCSTAILLQRGELLDHGPTHEVINSYLDSEDENKIILEGSRYVESIACLNQHGKFTGHYLVGESLLIDISLKNLNQLASPNLGVLVCNHFGDRLILLAPHIQSQMKLPPARKATLRVTTEPLNLLPGRYKLEIGIGSGYTVVERLQGLPGFTVEYADLFQTGKLPNAKQGILALKAQWCVVELN